MKSKHRARYERVLFIIPSYGGEVYSLPTMPFTGVGYLSEMLLKNGIDNNVLDLRLKYKLSDILNAIESYRPDLIAVSMMTFMYKKTYELINRIKESTNIDIIVGGPHISTFREKTLEECRSIDFGCITEGETLLIELCKGRNIRKIGNLIYRDKERIIFNGIKSYTKNLDELPFPRYSRFELDKYMSREMPILTSRGCPFNCNFCTIHTSIGKKFRVRSPKSIADEIEYWSKKGYKQFNIIDDNFTLIQKRVFDTCDEIEKRNITDLNMRCGNGVRADRVNEEILKRMKDIGFNQLSFGVEVGNDKMLKAINKMETMEQIESAIDLSCRLGFDVELFFIIGSPKETEADIKDSFNIALKYPVTTVTFYNLIPFPDTELYNYIENNAKFITKPSTYLNQISQWQTKPVFETDELSETQRKRMLEKAHRIMMKVEKRTFLKKNTGILNLIIANAVFTKYGKRLYRIALRNKKIAGIKNKIHRT